MLAFPFKRIKSSALGYAISFMLLAGLICSGLLFVASTNKRIEVIHQIGEHLIFDNLFALTYAAQTNLPKEQQIIHPSGDTSHISTKNWGAFKMVHVLTKHGRREQRKTALVGYEVAERLPALYLPDYQQALKLGGKTRIEGTAYLPERGLERAYIAGQNYAFDQLLFGEKKTSTSALPPLKKRVKDLRAEQFLELGKRTAYIGLDSNYSFALETTVYSQIEAIYVQANIRGNVVIHSFDSIYVGAEAKLSNVILVAPIIRFAKGFTGQVQAFATRKIVCEEQVRLNYPSTLCVNEIKNEALLEPVQIQLQQGAKVLGGILIESQAFNFRSTPRLLIASEAVVGGLVYNVGTTELQGSVIGHLYTYQFSLSNGGGQYVNHLLNATISSKKLPENFLLPEWLESMEAGQSKLITWF